MVRKSDGSHFAMKTISAAIHTIGLGGSVGAGKAIEKTDTFFLSKETSVQKAEVTSVRLHVSMTWLLISWLLK